jgi:hypothetical protein
MLKTWILKNDQLEVHIDHPLHGYDFSRFDWMGKIRQVRFKGMLLTTSELLEETSESGVGLYNEFGIEQAIGFDEAQEGAYFHKIGVGQLKKEGSFYQFYHPYKMEPAVFTNQIEENRLSLRSESRLLNGYAYILQKEISINEDSLTIQYTLVNKGEKPIQTSEYVHNFLAIDHARIGEDYILKLPKAIDAASIGQIVNPNDTVSFHAKEVRFNGAVKEVFFFSHLLGDKEVPAAWELIHQKKKVSIKETGDFTTQKINLWGNGHVISPELFIDINVLPGKEQVWSRKYEFGVLNGEMER